MVRQERERRHPPPTVTEYLLIAHFCSRHGIHDLSVGYGLSHEPPSTGVRGRPVGWLGRGSRELDLAAEAQFTIAIDEALKVPAPALVVDLRELDFMDSCGIRCLVK